MVYENAGRGATLKDDNHVAHRQCYGGLNSTSCRVWSTLSFPFSLIENYLILIAFMSGLNSKSNKFAQYCV